MKLVGWNRRRALLLFACVAISTGCAAHKAAAVPELRPGLLVGYLASAALPNSFALVPPPPAAGSPQFAVDDAYSRRGLALRDTPAWTLATSDADQTFPHAADTFSCALNVSITEAHTPHLYMLLRRSLTDAGLSTYAAKNHYQRTRPFMSNDAPICTPSERAMLEKDGSYPSGHSAVGMAWSLILAEISPEQSDAILARGRAYAASRIVCNVHWANDTWQGRYMGAYTVARLHAEPAFQADLAAARSELATVRANGGGSSRDCAAEAAGIALQRSLDQTP
jgi:acid phosphatase (class A)